MIKKEHLFVVLTAILWGTIAVGGQFFANFGLSLYEISIFRCIFVVLLTLIVLLVSKKEFIPKKALFFFLVYGFIGAMLDLTVFGGVVLGVSVAVVAFSLNSQPIWTALFGRIMLGERVNSKKVIAILFALAGMAFLLKIWNIGSMGNPIGVLLAVLGGVFMSLWIIWAKKANLDNLHFTTTMFGWSLSQLLWLIVLYPLTALVIKDQSIVGLSLNSFSHYWFLFLLFALVSGVIPYFFLHRGLDKLQASVAGIILLLEPVSSAVLASVFFNQQIGIYILIGGALILTANIWAIYSEKSPATPDIV